MQNFFLKAAGVLLLLYAILCGIGYFIQEKLIFFPEKLADDYQFPFDQNFEEIKIKTQDNETLHGLLFKAQHSKGLLFYLHGNGGALDSWGGIAQTYTNLKYDIFILDYRGYGKSSGSIKSQSQFYDDVQLAYNHLKKRYTEDSITVIGYSIGTGAATKLASENHPKLLILQAPYYSLTDMVKHLYPFVPTFILKYKFETNKFIRNCKMPIVIFHGDQDNVIYYESSLKLKENLKSTDRLVTLYGQGHNGITDNPSYLEEMKKLLSE